ncbi:MAG: hypothetical protein A2571_01345 [Candidatus Vogelbacteria bacterium RIFOXYD1_FULL_44_32]|uniref:Uncharacterized protein n=1 Tax=Candidatus Vogelbacteria bacterium RIFOXYD1_FULL_44_32 TaxID=1802438 RepID=A0A1G2QD40_9BACT|nr:MAG: hypothetical protein A2571_01345 [Candidatus Vogelbacteria bacterium RIFOXYD1_FULL_44_32]
MKVLSLGLDNSVLNQASKVADRLRRFEGLVAKYVVIVPSYKSRFIELAPTIHIYGVSGFGKVGQLWQIYRLANKLVKTEGYNILTVQDTYYLALVGWLIAKKNKLPLEIQVHGFEKENYLRQLVARFVLKKAQVVRVVSGRLKYEVCRDYNLNLEQVYILPIFPPLLAGPLPKSDYNIGQRFMFLAVGRLVPIKRFDLQLRAVAQLALRHSNFELCIVGDGPERVKLETLAVNLGIRNLVEFCGHQSPFYFYHKADVFLLTSDREGWGMVAIEAAAAGLPIIMTDVGLAGEVLHGNKEALIIPTGDEEALVEAMANLMTDDKLRCSLGTNATKAIAKLPAGDKVASLYIKEWKKLL